ncbi:MAG: transporter, family, chloramphenicol resistance protein [Cryptosporangiaceae bacterium]|jgi:MFS family permease|nr:transporter, family, chloramphenicol resistance protein [Cryptosporangiaceae bacterium]
MAADAAHEKTKLPPVVALLALGTFLMCTTEFMIAGLLAQMADDFGVRPSQIGLLITAFAIGMIVGAPLMAIATLRLPKRLTLVLALAIFAAGHIVASLSGSFALLVAARVLTAVVTGAFWSVASVVATRAAGPAASSRALGVMAAASLSRPCWACRSARSPASISAGAAPSGLSLPSPPLPPWSSADSPPATSGALPHRSAPNFERFAAGASGSCWGPPSWSWAVAWAPSATSPR